MRTTMRCRLLASLQAVCQRAVRRRPKAPGSEIALCRRKTFKRWSQPDRRGWTLRGRFYGGRGQFLGKRFSLSENDLARGVAVLGPDWQLFQGILFPAIADRMRHGHSLVITDLSGSLQIHVESVAAATGHLVLAHQINHPATSCALNPCEWIDGGEEARSMATILVSSTRQGVPSGNRLATEAAIDLVAACALHYRSFIRAGDVRQDLRGLVRELAHSQIPGVPDLVGGIRTLAAQDANLLKAAIAAFDAGLAPWNDPVVREIGGENGTFAPLSAGLDLAGQLTGVPTVMLLRFPSRRADRYGPYMGALLYALAASLTRLGVGRQDPRAPIAVGSLPVGFVLAEWATLGRLDTLLRDARGCVSILATAKSIAEFTPFYPARDEAERLPASLATQIVFGGCDQPTAKAVSRLGGGLILPEDVTGLAREHAIILTPGSGEGRASRIILHGVPTLFSERRDWKGVGTKTRSITVLPRPLQAQAPPALARRLPETPSEQAVPTRQAAEPPGSQPRRRTAKDDAIERLLADAPESDRKKDRDLWTNENW
jgi:hypothetical protein